MKRPRTRSRSRSRRRHHSNALPSPNATIKSSHYYAKMAFDGRTLVSETKKNNGPVNRRVYTLKQLKQEIPLAGKFVEEDLDGVVPEAINYPIPKEIAFRSVLPNPADLGLLPPRESRRPLSVRRIRHSRRNRSHNPSNNDDKRENMRLVVEDIDDADADDDADRRSDLFGLPK